MVVRSEIMPGRDRYINRGIFKNPISFMQDGAKYPRLSLKLHGFSAAVAHHISNNICYMTVNPAPSMRVILVNIEWSRGDLLIDDKDVLDYSPKEIEEFKSKDIFFSEPLFRIKINPLINLYM